jgi:hypothetical protein
MEPEQFRLIDALGNSLLKLDMGKFKAEKLHLIDQPINQQLGSNELALLLGHPNDQIQIRSFKLLQSLDPNRFRNKKQDKIQNLMTKEERARYRQFILHYLTSNIHSHYLYARQYILDNIQDFRNELIHNLASNSDGLVQNICEILHKGFPDQFSSPNFYEVMRSLQNTEKDEILQIVKIKIQNSIDIPWNLRDGLIRILGALNYPLAAEYLIRFTDDPDQNVRWTLAISLGYVHTPISVKALYRLLLDQDDEIRQTAADSLGKIFPGLYQNKPPQEILYIMGKADPLELFQLMRPECFNPIVNRVWRRLEYEIEIIKQGLRKETSEIINLLVHEKFRGIDFGAERTYFLLLSARMPESIDQLERQINLETNESKRSVFKRIRDQLHDRFKVHAKEDLFVLL